MTDQAREPSVVISDASAAAEVLRATRLALGLKQEDVAKKAGLARRTLYKLETERRSPNLGTLILWAAALGMIVRIEQGEQIAAQLASASADADLLARTRERLASGAAGRIRLDAQVTQAAMAEAIGCDQSVIARWEVRKSAPRPSGLFLAYGRLLDALEAGEQLVTSRSFGHDMLGVRLDNLLRREGVSRERAQAMTDAELRALPGLGARAVRRIREWSATGAAPAREHRSAQPSTDPRRHPVSSSDTTAALEPGDRVRVNTPGQPHHDREGTITHAAPISTVTLDGDHGDLRLFERHELTQLSEDGYDGIQAAIDQAEAWMDAYASHHTQPGAPEAGDPPVTALAVLIAVLRDSQRALGWPDDGERLAGWNVYKHRDDSEPSYWLGPESVFSPAFEADDDDTTPAEPGPR